MTIAGCQRGNGDGLPLNSWEVSTRHRFCQCAICRANRWVARETLLGRLNGEQQRTARDLIEHLAEALEANGDVLRDSPSEDDVEHEEDYS